MVGGILIIFYITLDRCCDRILTLYAVHLLWPEGSRVDRLNHDRELVSVLLFSKLICYGVESIPLTLL